MKRKTAWTEQSQQAAATKNNDRSNRYVYNNTAASSRQVDSVTLAFEFIIRNWLLSRLENRLVNTETRNAHQTVDCILFLKENTRGC
jgi:hypothetical protein